MLCCRVWLQGDPTFAREHIDIHSSKCSMHLSIHGQHVAWFYSIQDVLKVKGNDQVDGHDWSVELCGEWGWAAGSMNSGWCLLFGMLCISRSIILEFKLVVDVFLRGISVWGCRWIGFCVH